jgi:hypothetical protein
MQPLACPHCGEEFFDPNKIWTSPGQLTTPKTGKIYKTVVQCAECNNWITVLVNDDGTPLVEPPDKK